MISSINTRYATVNAPIHNQAHELHCISPNVFQAKCFRRWFNNVLHARVRNFQILQAARSVSPISYGVMVRK